jgi:hypothetical protein
MRVPEESNAAFVTVGDPQNVKAWEAISLESALYITRKETVVYPFNNLHDEQL